MNIILKFISILVFIFICSEQVLSKNINDSGYVNFTPYFLLKDNLYTNESDELFFQTYDLRQGNLVMVFLKRFLFDRGNNIVDKKLSDVIDPSSWKKIGRYMYRDKDNLYCFQPQTMGGFLVHLKSINPNKLFFLNENGWNPFLNNKTNEIESLYTSDGTTIFYVCNIVKDADYSTFRLANNKSLFLAIDKNNKYHGTKVIGVCG